MTISNLLRAMFWAAAFAFLADLLRRCWIVEAWSVGLVAAIPALACLWRLVWAVERIFSRKRLHADFVRPNTPKFPEQPRRGIR